jgi:iron complex transport system ATP-binding protein
MEQTGILNIRHKQMVKLSGGEQQKAYLAMLLAQSTNTILLDEPTTHLDISYQLELMQTLKNLKQTGKCIIAVLHDLPMALEYADKIAVMKNGRILIIATPQAVLESGCLETALGVKFQQETAIKAIPI